MTTNGLCLSSYAMTEQAGGEASSAAIDPKPQFVKPGALAVKMLVAVRAEQGRLVTAFVAQTPDGSQAHSDFSCFPSRADYTLPVPPCENAKKPQPRLKNGEQSELSWKHSERTNSTGSKVQTTDFVV